MRKSIDYLVEKRHDEKYKQVIETRYGSEPGIECFETVVIVDNESGVVLEPSPELVPVQDKRILRTK